MAVYIVVEMHFVILIGDGSSVNDKNGHTTSQTHGDIVFAILHLLLHALERPARIVAEDPSCELGGLFDANAPGAKIAGAA
jgi:hypothetical protein